MKKAQLKKLHQEIRNCKKCPLWKFRKNAVPGEGSVNAEIFLCGQSPGFKENLTGKPFCGRAGKFLDQLLKITKIKRDKVFITSLLKCLPQPPINRKPKKEEIEACSPYLKKQIKIINPQKFILLGDVAFSVFFPGKKLGKFRGKWVKKDKKKYFITYHPAAGIRFPRIRTCLRRDFVRLRQNLDSLM